MSAPQLFVGIDVAKAQLDIALRPTGEHWAVTNDEPGIVALVVRLQAVQPTLVVLEATGGYQRAVVGALAAAGLPVAVVNPRQAHDFAKATGQLAKTDALDARALAHFAEAVRPTPRPLPDAQADELRALLAQRGPVSVGASPSAPTPEPIRRAFWPARSPKAMRCCTEATMVRAAALCPRHGQSAQRSADRSTRLRRVAPASR